MALEQQTVYIYAKAGTEGRLYRNYGSRLSQPSADTDMYRQMKTFKPAVAFACVAIRQAKSSTGTSSAPYISQLVVDKYMEKYLQNVG